MITVEEGFSMQLRSAQGYDDLEIVVDDQTARVKLTGL